jgi:hypothetical protein
MSHQRRILTACAFALIFGVCVACSGTPNPSTSKAQQGAPEQNVANAVRSPNPTSAARADARAKARAKAEAEAEAKNQANRKSYEAEVERVKAAHAEKLERYRVEKDAYDTALAKYKIDKTEVEAGRKLKLARIFLDEKQSEIASRRLREIIKDYPDTQAAKDAKIILGDGYVRVRDFSVDPVAPVAPIEPRLVLPTEPLPVPVIYPFDDDEEPVKVADESKIPDSDYVTTKNGEYQTAILLGNGKTVYVRGYFRSDGTYVQPHMRSQPGSGSKAASGTRRR